MGGPSWKNEDEQLERENKKWQILHLNALLRKHLQLLWLDHYHIIILNILNLFQNIVIPTDLQTLLMSSPHVFIYFSFDRIKNKRNKWLKSVK